MKLAKKTLSVALAAIMAASSFAGTISAFAADSVLPSVPTFKAVSVGTTKVTPEVKIDTQYATKDATDLYKQVDATSLTNYYSFTPAKTGVYKVEIESTALFRGYNQKKYLAKIASYTNFKNMTPEQQAQIIEAAKKEAYVWANDYKGLFSDTTFAADKALTAADAIDTVTIANVDDKTALLGTNATTTSKEVTEVNKVLSWKYDTIKKDVVVDKEVKEVYTGRRVSTNDDYLVAGKTYYFSVTVANFDTLVEGKEVLDKDKKVEKVEAVKTNAPASATVKISAAATGVQYDKFYINSADSSTDDIEPQKVAVPDDYTGAKEYDKTTNGFYVSKDIDVAKVAAYYYGDATTAKIADTFEGAKVTYFENYFKGITAITLGKYVEEVVDLDEEWAPNLVKVTITNPDFIVESEMFTKGTVVVAPANSVARLSALAAGYKVETTCTHKWTTVKAATIFAAGQRKCSECDKVEAIAKKAFAPTAKVSGKKIECKGNAGKVAKLAVWVYDSKGKLVKKQVKTNVTKNTVKVAKAGKYTVKIKAYGTNGAKTASVKKTVKVK